MTYTYETSKVDWTNANLPVADDFQRIENNTAYIQDLLG